ncbi:type VI secretion system-associated protein TagF [Myxococcaceae bacterium JPH2]|nr:type VI secretion system-associated protein TagF [Myxococcaceae bacterium JPH2]
MAESSSRIGLLGKTPRQAEFIRLHAATPLALRLHGWLEEGVERARRARVALPSQPVRFVFTLPGAKQVLVGLMAPSRDSVGRDFPLAVFAEVPSNVVAGRGALVPEGFRPFFQAATALVERAAEMEVTPLLEHATALPLPGPGDLGTAERLRVGALTGHGPAELLSPIVEGTPDGGRYYALHTFLTACAGERGREQSAATVGLDCPLSAKVGPVPWLELATRLLKWNTLPPAFFWSEGDAPRLLLCLGAATPSYFLHLAQPSRPGAQVWPLRTERPAALAQARAALSATQRQVIDSPTTSLEHLLRALAR